MESGRANYTIQSIGCIVAPCGTYEQLGENLTTTCDSVPRAKVLSNKNRFNYNNSFQRESNSIFHENVNRVNTDELLSAAVK